MSQLFRTAIGVDVDKMEEGGYAPEEFVQTKKVINFRKLRKFLEDRHFIISFDSFTFMSLNS